MKHKSDDQPVRRSSKMDQTAFSPIRLVDPHPPAGVNLTGVPRRVKDRCADIYNVHKKWQENKLLGAELIKRIADKRNRLSEIPDLCDSLLGVVDNLEKLVDILTNAAQNFDSLVRIDNLSSSSSALSSQTGAGDGAPSMRSDRAVFVNLSLDDFARMVRAIEEAFRKELVLKKEVARQIPHQTSKNVLMFSSLCWMFDPHVDERTRATILSLVAECGFK
ncbi:cyclin-dependent kinase 2-interacting protein [Galendromus occidentalis]|uniref:Cyclin-dependent kinase 2-interacting protein n=1 Tax=Galendromus occidentalis TaxID=34638 RepID=A0AAJ7P9Q2_9ACAR|nr:cyclin-dependent kinase 2-interacting protein [Galendromus occidentalis]